MKHEAMLRKINADTVRRLKLLTKEELKIFLSSLIMDAVAVLGILSALIIFHQPLLMDLFICDIMDPFNLQQGWLLWAIIGVIFAYTATFGTTFATKYFSKRWPQSKTKDSIATGHERDQLTGSPIVSILLWLVMVALLLPPLAEEYVCRGYLTALLTKWLATTTVVVITSFMIAFAHWNSEQLSYLFVDVLAFVLTYVKTRTLMTLLAMHLLMVMVQCSVIFITFMRRSFSQGIGLLHPAKEVSNRARSKRARSKRARRKNLRSSDAVISEQRLHAPMSCQITK